MSEKETLDLREKLNQGLKESFEKMLLRKKQLGESVVTCDEKGNVITLSAEEAWNLYEERKKTKNLLH